MRYEFITSPVGKLPLRTGFDRCEADSMCSFHYHEEIEILPVERGDYCVYIGDEEIKMSSGDVIIIDSLIPHATYVPKDTVSGLFQFNPERLTGESQSRESLYKFLRRSKKPYTLFVHGDENTAELMDILRALAHYSNAADGGDDAYTKGYIYILIGFMYKTGIWTDTERGIDLKALDGILGAAEYIEKHYGDEITLGDIAAELCLNTSYFCRLFRRATGGTPIEYLNYIRIQEAKKLLADKEKSIADIAFETGFQNIANFNRTFKRINSSTPSAYRKLCR